MADDGITLTREALYERIWEQPATKLAAEFGISDVALGKICRKLDIPKPFPGYWQRIASGYTVNKSALPALKTGTLKQITIYPHTVSAPVQYPPEVAAHIEAEGLPENHIHVAETLRGCHPLVRQAKQTIEKPMLDEYGRMHGYLNLRVSKTSLGRALRITDALLRAAEKRGYKVEISKQSPYLTLTQIRIGDERMAFRIFEKSDRRDRELTMEEKRKPLSSISNRWVYTPSGQLIIEVSEHGSYWERKWADKPNKPLEEQLNDVMIGFILSTEESRVRRLKWEEEARRRQEAEHRRYIDERRRATLDRHAEMWHKSQNIRTYLQACEQSIVAGEEVVASDSSEARWLRWARGYADRLDPTKNGGFEEAVRQFIEDE